MPKFKPKRCRRSSRMAGRSKAAALRAGSSVVSLVTHNLPEDMCTRDGLPLAPSPSREFVLTGCGIIVECEYTNTTGADHAACLATVIAPAILFHRTNSLHPTLIKVDVVVSGGKLFEGKLLACDFHNNLAAVSICSDTPLQAALLKGLDDASSADINGKSRFQLSPHSNLFKVSPKTKIMTLRRDYEPPCNLILDRAGFRASPLTRFDCKELYGVGGDGYEGDHGGAVINNSGEVIGLMFYDCVFLPSNIILRWWCHYKSHRKFCRPYVGVHISNLAVGRLDNLEQLAKRFFDICTGVVVTEVEKDTPAYCSGIKPNDVIIKCDGRLVRSKMEFFETMWDNAGKPVELTVLRIGDDQPLTFSMTIKDTAPDKLSEWMVPNADIITAAKNLLPGEHQ